MKTIPTQLALIGPTASGKSALAVQIAKNVGGVVLTSAAVFSEDTIIQKNGKSMVSAPINSNRYRVAAFTFIS